MHLKGLVDRYRRRIRDAFRPRSVPLGFLQDLARTRHQLLAKDAALRHRLLVLSRTTKMPNLRPLARVILVAIAAVTSTSREIVVHVGVTRNPSAEWSAPQLRDATPFGEGSEFLIRDRDSTVGASFDRVAQRASIRIIITPVKSPNMNAVRERFIGSARRECLNHVLVLAVKHMKSVLNEYALASFNHARPHRGIRQKVPGQESHQYARTRLNVIGLPVLKRLHYDDGRAA